MTHDIALACWTRALTEEFGIILILESPDDKRMIEKALYDARQASGDPRLQELSLVKPGDKPEEFWIIKKTTDMSDITNAPTP